MKKNIAIVLLVLALLLSLGYTYYVGGFAPLLSKSATTEELIPVDTTAPLVTQEDQQSMDDAARSALLDLHQQLTFNGESHRAVEFPWATEDGEVVLVPGMSFTLSPLLEEDREKIQEFFSSYVSSTPNQADGPTGSIMGYQNDLFVCRLEEQRTQTEEEAYSDLIVSCGSLTNSDMSEISRLFAAIKSASGTPFSTMSPVDFPWSEEDGSITYLKGAEMSTQELSAEKDPGLNELFTAWGWTPDEYNMADGTMVGAVAYTNGDLRCRITVRSRIVEGEEGDEEDFLSAYLIECGR